MGVVPRLQRRKACVGDGVAGFTEAAGLSYLALWMKATLTFQARYIAASMGGWLLKNYYCRLQPG